MCPELPAPDSPQNVPGASSSGSAPECARSFQLRIRSRTRPRPRPRQSQATASRTAELWTKIHPRFAGVHPCFYFCSALWAISWRKIAPSQEIFSTAQYAFWTAFCRSSPSAVTPRTLPPAVTSCSFWRRVPA